MAKTTETAVSHAAKRKVIFVTGTGHCGSTLLDMILGSHSQAFSLGQISKAPSRLREADGRGLCEICGPGCEFWDSQESRRLLQRYFGAALEQGSRFRRAYARLNAAGLDFYAELSRISGAPVLVDSSKSVWWIRKQMRSFWSWRNATPYLVFIQRDGRAVVNSLMRKQGRDRLVAITASWLDSVQQIEELYADFPQDRRHRLAYEDLASRPEHTIRELCARLNIAFEPEMLRYWRHDHHLISGNSGTYSALLRYRQEFAGASEGQHAAAGQDLDMVDREYYDQLGMAIRLDLRWKREMSEAEVNYFERFAGESNERYRYSA